ncbi:hypothetical protein F5884DRAFT_874332 [Xylogone sp. PMI_703]|nr:hypothetical protein F5884DRAFT_874332 [Xylogone sp. PMI_703]
MPTKSKYPDVEIPNVDLWDFLFSRTDREFPDNKVIFSDIDTSRAYTYQDLRNLSIKFGAGLRAKENWQKGDVLGLFTPNDIDYPVVMWGTHWAGGIASLINPNYTASELEFQLLDSGVKLLVTHPSLLPTVLKATKKIGFPTTKIFLLGDERLVQPKSFKHYKSLASPVPLVKATVSPKDDISFLIYSSGTTGKPKGVMLTHSNIISNVLMHALCLNHNLTWNGGPAGKGDSMIGFLPFFHSYGLTALVLFAPYIGIEIIVMPKFDLEKFCAVTEQRKVTFHSVVPPVLLLLSKSPIVDKYDMSSVRLFNSGAAPLTKELVNDVQKRLNITVIQGYGLSETSPVTHAQTWEDNGLPVGSIGRLYANQSSKFVSPTGEEVPDGEPGELWVKGPNVFKGYLNNEAATKNALTDDGWFKTGDIGYQDKDGNAFITDRLKELIKYNAFQVAPAELEGVLMSHPKIADVAVVGVYDSQRQTEVPRAYVVTTPGIEQNESTTQEITKWMGEKVANHKQLRGGIRYVNEIPKTASGKILRSALRAKAKEDVDPLKSKL